jgi:hypothetical protein
MTSINGYLTVLSSFSESHFIFKTNHNINLVIKKNGRKKYGGENQMGFEVFLIAPGEGGPWLMY